VVFYTFRGKDFRKEYGHVGEMRGLLNTSVNEIALTATATKQTRKDLCKSLCLLNPVMILESPEKSNIVYSVLKKVADIEETFAPLAEEIRKSVEAPTKQLYFVERMTILHTYIST